MDGDIDLIMTEGYAMLGNIAIEGTTTMHSAALSCLALEYIRMGHNFPETCIAPRRLGKHIS